MKKIYGMILIFIFMLSFNVVNANTINSIKMDIYVDNSGDAHVTEIWDCYATQDTEWYHTYNNIGNSNIVNLTVKDEDNILYESLGKWNINGSFNDKKYKSGLNHTGNGTEVCFGISEYNTQKTYTANYTITNFVSNLTDSQMMYWTLIDFEKEIGEVYIKIHSDFRYSDTVGVWGYGNYGGTAYVYDGYIEMQSPGNLETNEYMTILVQFPQNTFKGVTNNLNNDFNYYLGLAESRSTKYDDSDDTMAGIITFSFIALWIFLLIKSISNASNEGKIIPTKEAKLLKDYKEYYRDIPCNKDIFRAYYISYEYNIINNKSDLLGAMLLKWFREKNISIQKREVGIIKKKEEDCIVFNKDTVLDNELENRLYQMMYKASKDGVLEKKEFEKWAEKNYENVFGWFDDVVNKERQKLIEDGILKSKEKKSLFVSAKDKYEFVNKEIFHEEAKNLKGLRNYLKAYTLIHEREAIEVTLFEEYLIMAQIFGIAKTVIKEFKDLYPELINESSFESYDNLTYIHYTSHNSMKSASEAYSRARSYSSGGGGFSSGGGGGGSFGGGRRWFTIIINKRY